MRILVATGPFPPEAGGPATYVALLMKGVPEGTSIDVLPFRSVAGWPYLLKHIVYFLKLLVRTKGVDAVFAQDPVSVGVPALWAAKIARKRFILRVGGDYAWEQSVQRFGVTDMLDTFVTSRYGLRVSLLKRIQKMVALNAESIIVSGHYLKKIVTLWGVPSSRIHVVYNAFSPQVHLRETKEELRAELSIDSPSLFSAGRLVPWKGMSVLIEAVSDLVREYPTLTLHIAGDGPERKRLETLVRDTHLEKNVFLLGLLPHDTLFRFLKAADVFVLNTGYEAGVSYQILEAMNIGTPVVTTSAGDNRELIENGKSGILFSYNDKNSLVEALRSILSGSVSADVCAQNAREKAELYTPERMIDETLKIVTRV